MVGNESDNHKDCSDEEEGTIQEITNIIVHLEDDRSMKSEGNGLPQTTGEMMKRQANKTQCYRCGCGCKFETIAELESHMANVHNNNDAETVCSKCNFKALTQEDLKKHSDIKHKPSPANKKPNTYDKCYDCQLIVNGYKELMSHKKRGPPIY